MIFVGWDGGGRLSTLLDDDDYEEWCRWEPWRQALYRLHGSTYSSRTPQVPQVRRTWLMVMSIVMIKSMVGHLNLNNNDGGDIFAKFVVWSIYWPERCEADSLYWSCILSQLFRPWRVLSVVLWNHVISMKTWKGLLSWTHSFSNCAIEYVSLSYPHNSDWQLSAIWWIVIASIEKE